jgi:NAD(P)-dependent dehydrogenase (short-subunit alcohol dehydrogenase family)
VRGVDVDAHRLDGRRVLVVGASSGIGRAIGIAATRAGAHVALAARRREECAKASAEAGSKAIPFLCDVTSPESCADLVDSVVDQFGGLDALVYAAGVSPLARLADAEIEAWRTIIDTNLIGAGLATKCALPHLRASSGRAVFLSSSSVGRPYPALSMYAASKAGLEEMIRGWRAENPDLCFSCVVVGPTAQTGFADLWDGELAAEMFAFWQQHGYDEGAHAMHVDDVAAVVLDILASPVCIQHVWPQADPGRSVGHP